MLQFGTTGAGRTVPGVDRHHALKAVKKYKSWLKYELHFETLFRNADTDESGRLSVPQLKKLLQQIAIEQGFNPNITQDDVDFVLNNVEEEHQAELTLEEAGPAVAAWTEVAEVAPPATIFNFCCPSKPKSAKVSPHSTS